MTDPELIVLLIAALRCVLRLTDALAHQLVLRGQAELTRTAAAAEAVVELSDAASRGRAQRFVIRRATARRQS